MYYNVNYDLCKQVNRVKLNLIAFGHARVGNEWNGFVSSPVFSRLYYIVGGNSAIAPQSGEKTKLAVRKWYLIPTGCSFDYECDGDMEHYYFHLKLCDFDGTDLLRKCKKPLPIDMEEGMVEFMKECIDSENILDGLKLHETVLNVLLAILKRHNVDIRTENYSPCVMKAIRYIRENLSVQLTISEIA